MKFSQTFQTNGFVLILFFCSSHKMRNTSLSRAGLLCLISLPCFLCISSVFGGNLPDATPPIHVIQTAQNTQDRLSVKPDIQFTTTKSNGVTTIALDTNTRYQKVSHVFRNNSQPHTHVSVRIHHTYSHTHTHTLLHSMHIRTHSRALVLSCFYYPCYRSYCRFLVLVVRSRKQLLTLTPFSMHKHESNSFSWCTRREQGWTTMWEER